MNDNIDLNGMIREKTQMVLEQMCFMFSEDGASELPTYYPEARASVPFSGDASGRVEILTYGNIMSEIALNMSGDDQMDREHQLDAIGEFGNVLCGNLLPAVAEGHFTIGKPEVSEGFESEPGSVDCPSAEFVFPDGTIKVIICLE